MPIYKYEGKTLKGQIKKGEFEAPDEGGVRVYLRQQNIIPTKITPKGKEIKFSLPFRKKVNQRAIAIFTRQLATMIDAGLPLVQSLEILSVQQEQKLFKDIIREIREDVEGGSTFAGALKKHPAAFDDLYTNLVVAGEEGGILDNILLRLAGYIEKAEALKKKVKSAMVYPATIIGVAVIVVMILMIFVIPVFESMFKGAGQTLPLPTLIVMGMSKLIKKYVFIVVPVFILLLYLLRRYHKTENGRAVIDRLLLKMPVLGPLLQKISVARFSRTLGTLVSSGVPILDGYLLTGRHPYTGRNPRELFQQLLRDPPMPLSQADSDLRFPPALDAAVMHGLARDPAQRPQTTTAFAGEIEAALAGASAPQERGGFLGALFGKRKG